MKRPAISAAAAAIDIGPLLATARKTGLEAGWSGTEKWTALAQDSIRSELRLLQRGSMPEIGEDLSVLQDRRTRLRAEAEQWNERRARTAMQFLEASPSRPTSKAWHWPRLITLGAFLGITGLVAEFIGFHPGGRGWAILALAGVLLHVWPLAAGAGLRSAGAMTIAALRYSCNTWRAIASARRLDRAERAIEHERLRREVAERWISERLDWLLSQYLLARERGEQAHLIHSGAQL